MTSDAELPTFRGEPSPASQQQASAVHAGGESSPDDAEENSDDSDGEPEVKRRASTRRRRSSAQVDDDDVKPTPANVLSDDLRTKLDQIFETFLTAVCSDRETSVSLCVLPSLRFMP